MNSEIGASDYQIRGNTERGYPVYTGRTIFEQLTISGFNKAPVNLHRTRALRGVKVDESAPDTPESVCNLLLIEGSPVYRWSEYSEWEPLTNIITATATEVWQLVESDMYSGYHNDKCVWRHFLNTGESWQIRDIKPTMYGMEAQIVREMPAIPTSDILVYENGRGILYDNQWTYQRLEEIGWELKRETSDFSLGIIIVGMVSPNPEDALEKLASGKRIANIPGQGAQIERVGDSRVHDQLRAEKQELARDYFRDCFLLDTADQPNRPVGLDLQLRLEPQTGFIEELRRKIAEVYTMLGYSGELEFKRLETQTPQDRETEIRAVIQAVEAGLLDAGTAKQVIANLWG